METIILIILGLITLIHITTSVNFQENQEYMYYFSKEVDWSKSYGTHNGYVCIPKSSKLYGRLYWDMNFNEDGDRIIDHIQEQLENVKIHGGLTYSGDIRGNNTFVFGFDTQHYSDTQEEQNEEYVLKECDLLIKQLEKIK